MSGRAGWTSLAVAKRPKKPELHMWAIYHVAAEQKFVGSAHDAEAAIEAYSVPPTSAAG